MGPRHASRAAAVVVLAGLLATPGMLVPSMANAEEQETRRWTGTVYLGSIRGPVMDRGVFPTLDECREFVEKFAANRRSSAKQVSEQEDEVRFEIPVPGMTGYEAHCRQAR